MLQDQVSSSIRFQNVNSIIPFEVDIVASVLRTSD